MEESVIATFDNVKFIEGETQMSQANWQEYFSEVIPNGICSGFEIRNYVGNTIYTNGRRFITDGTAFVNGLFVKVETDEGYTDIGTPPSLSLIYYTVRFVCLRVYFNTQKAQIVAKNDIMIVNDINRTYEYFLNDESYNCERNDVYWDIPLFYQTDTCSDLSNNTSMDQGGDLRRFVGKQKPQTNPDHGIKTSSSNPNYSIGISGNNLYVVDDVPASQDINVFIDCANIPEKAYLVVNLADNVIRNNVIFYNVPFRINQIYNPNGGSKLDTGSRAIVRIYPKNSIAGSWGSSYGQRDPYDNQIDWKLYYYFSGTLNPEQSAITRWEKRAVFKIEFMGESVSSNTHYFTFSVDPISEAVSHQAA